MRWRRTTLVVSFVVTAMVFGACTDSEPEVGDDVTSTTSTTIGVTPAPDTTAPPVETTDAGTIQEATRVVVWADEKRASVVEQAAPAFTEATGVEVVTEIIDFFEIRTLVQSASPVGEGPDLFVGAHDWTAELVEAGVVEPIDLGARSTEFVQPALDGFSHGGRLYGVPYGSEAVAMYYNADLVPEPPATWDEAVADCAALPDVRNCVGVPGGGDMPDAYHNYPFLSAAGGYVFGFDPATGYDVTDVGLDGDGSVAGATFLEEQTEAGTVLSVDYDAAKDLFLQGVEPFWITGPWEARSLGETSMSWGVATLPTMNGGTPRPFIEVHGFFLGASSASQVAAISFLLDVIATEDTMLALYEADPRSPTHLPTLDVISSDPVAAAFGSSAADGMPWPNVREMEVVWGPLGESLLAVRDGSLDASDAMEAAASAVEEALAAR